MTAVVPTKKEWAQAVRGYVLEALEVRGPSDLFGIQAYVGFAIGATHEQVAYAVRRLSEEGDIMYDRRFREYRKF